MLNIKSVCKTSRQSAELMGFPPFVGPERESTPFNATPYIAHIDDVGKDGFLSNREAFLVELRVGLGRLRELDARPVAALLGGSCIGVKPDPSDLDCVVFYEAVSNRVVQSNLIATLQREMKPRRLDVRFVPLDGDPLILLKAVSFFTTLYCKDAGSLEIKRGLVLLDCRSISNQTPIGSQA